MFRVQQQATDLMGGSICNYTFLCGPFLNLTVKNIWKLAQYLLTSYRKTKEIYFLRR